MKMILFFTFMLVTASLMFVADAQTTGANVSGTGNLSTFDTTLSQTYGAYDFWDARYGVQLNDGTTNSVKWYGIQGSGSPWINTVTNMPQFVSTVTTNNLAAINFEVGVSNVLKNYTLANLVNNSATKQFTFAICQCSEANSSSVGMFTMGWTSASNNNASIVRAIPHSTAPTTANFAVAFNTNSGIPTTQVTSGPTTNGFTWYMGSYSNGTLQVMQNLKMANTVFPNPGVLTVDTCTLAALSRTNNQQVASWNGRVAAFLFCTNASFGTTLTNLSYYLSTNYSGGYLRTFN
jgi:hypothetical protein